MEKAKQTDTSGEEGTASLAQGLYIEAVLLLTWKKSLLTLYSSLLFFGPILSFFFSCWVSFEFTTLKQILQERNAEDCGRK